MDERFPGVLWWCDKCGDCLNHQNGFSDQNDIWKCTSCGSEKCIGAANIYSEEDD